MALITSNSWDDDASAASPNESWRIWGRQFADICVRSSVLERIRLFVYVSIWFLLGCLHFPSQTENKNKFALTLEDRRANPSFASDTHACLIRFV